MSSPLPPEILDHIIDHLHDEPTALKACCLVSKSWIPRTRLHLFDRVEFQSLGSVRLWTEAFPDPSNSPAHYTSALALFNFETVNAAISEACPWVQSFNRIVEFQVEVSGRDSDLLSLTQLHGLSPLVESLILFYPSIPHPQALDFICSFPLLRDILVCSALYPKDNTYGWDPPQTSPKFTRSLYLTGNFRNITCGLLSLPGGLHFSKIKVSGPIETGDSREALVSICSGTLRSLFIEHYPVTEAPTMLHPLDLSKATKLKDLEFRWHEPNVQWISAAIQTIKFGNLRKITLQLIPTLPDLLEDKVRLEWRDLDHLLVQLWTTRSIRPVVTFGGRTGGLVPTLLPGLTSKGAVTSI